ncbi:MAG: type IV pilus secretin PilQ [Thermodesulfovibrionales bacterium]|nr:type IV pilus secretin PilQ [Thermodesulfovibrionales bacterium]
MKKKITAIALLILLLTLVAGQAALGQEYTATLTAIDVTDNSVEIKASSPFTYTVYKPSDPYLVVVELPGVGIGSLSDRIVPGKKGISEIKVSTISAPSPASKIEILLDAPNDIEPKYTNNTLTLNIKEIKTAAPARKRAEEPAAGQAAVETQAMEEAVETSEEFPAIALPPAKEIKNVTFGYKNGYLNLIIKADGAMKPNVFTLGNKIVVDIPGVSMAAALPEAVVSPVKAMRYGLHKDKARIVVDLTEKNDFKTRIEGDSMVIAFRVAEIPVGFKPETMAAAEKAEAAPTPVLEPKAAPVVKITEKLISLDFQTADIIPIFRLLGDVSGYNTVIHPQVSGKITIKLLNVPWEQALAIVLETFNLEKSMEGNILSIAPSGTFTKRKEEAKRLKEATQREEPLVEEVIPLEYAEAGDIKTSIENGKRLSPRGSVEVHRGENTLIVRDVAEKIEEILEYIKILNTPVPQVMIEAKIVEVSTDYAQSLGIRWTGSADGSKIAGVGDTVKGQFSVNSPTTTATGPGGVLAMTVGTAATKMVNLSLEALETVMKIKKLSNPKILTINKKSASIQQGVQIPVQTTTAAGSTTEFKNANLSLTVTPTIKRNYIEITVQANNDTPVSVGGATGINTQSVTTQALVKDGETLVLGGIYTRSETESTQGVPYLSKIPIIGWLFKTKSTSTPTKELMIFITPVIVKSDRAAVE